MPTQQSPHPRSPLPVTAAEVQPHSKLIECEPHGHPIQQRGDFRRESDGPAENAVTAHRRHQENAIVQMMNVGAAQEEIHVRHLPGHDEEHKHPCQDERDNEAEQGPARQRCAVSRCTMCSSSQLLNPRFRVWWERQSDESRR